MSTASLFNRGLAAMLEQQAALAKTQLQVATGKRILTPADDPVGAKRILDLNETLALTRQHQANADVAATRLGLEEATLASVTDLLHRVRELGVQGLNASLRTEDRQALARELEQRLAELLGLANTADGNGEFLFAGFATRTRPFSTDAAGSFVYNGDQGRRRLQIAASFEVEDSDPGSEVFMAIANGNGTFRTAADPANAGTGVIDPGSVLDASAFVPDTYTLSFTSATDFEVRDGASALVLAGTYRSGAAIGFNGIEVSIDGDPAPGDQFTVATSVNQSLFATVQNLIDVFDTPAEDGAGQAELRNRVNGVLVDLDQALDRVLQTRAEVGARLNAIDSEREVNADLELLIEQDLSRLENADLAELVTLLNQRLIALQAAQQSFARIQNLSLFNLLDL